MLPKLIVIALVFFGIFQKCTMAVVDVGLPLIQINHGHAGTYSWGDQRTLNIEAPQHFEFSTNVEEADLQDDLGDDYPEMQEEVHLEDFFWTGSGDGPPDYLKKVHTGISKGKEVIVKTETVVATVYVDGNNEIDIPICLDCFADDGGGGGTWDVGAIPPLNYSATDRRYWLLTVMSGFYTQKDNPMLEEKLARLYRLAFTRQQSKHLGINGAQQISGISIPTVRNRDRRRYTDTETTTEMDTAKDVEIIDMSTNNKHFIKKTAATHPFNTNSELATSSEESELELLPTTAEPHLSTTKSSEESTDYSAYVTLIPWELIQQNARSEKQISATVLESQIPPQLRAQLQQHPLLKRDHVRVVIHNVTQITEDDVQKGTVGGTYDEDVNEKIDERPIANQTELIYSVLVNGRPVLAVTAANDMKLVTETEVVDVIGKEIYMKAEPYLREPQATPLAPATRSGSVGFFGSIQNNPALVIVSSVAILLLLLLLVALLLMGRSRVREKNTEVNRTSSRNELLTDSQSNRPTSSGTVLDTGRSTAQSRDVGIQNLSFENENVQSSRKARIHFPGPPEHRTTRTSRRGSITSSDNTSDSSVYCPINPPTADVQRMLDDKAASLFERHKRRHHHNYDRAEGREEAVYTTVVSEKKRDKARHKTKRRYLSENRVGSLETSPVQRTTAHSSGDEVVTDSIDGDGLRPTYENFERNEAYNPHNNYHRNKLMHQKSIFVDKDYPDDEQLHANEAINKEIIRALQPSERSSDTGSIGSFLSMASVKAFPKNTLPEPLNRVLDPVFVTYYDNVDDSIPTAGINQSSAKTVKSQRKSRDRKDSLDASTIATIENFPAPKAPLKSSRIASQSDNPDPGVIGPIVWERHKKRLSEDAETDCVKYGRTDPDEYSPIRDPAAMRNHYEGLIEGAIQMYSSQDDLPMPLPTRDFTNTHKPTSRENRGSSARVPSYSSRPCNSDGRPATAQPEKTPKSNQSTQPPSPSSGAWGGSMHGSHSPLVRPMSAGPFHRPDPPYAEVFSKSSSSRADLSAAPLIEAIQNELRKFKQDSK